MDAWNYALSIIEGLGHKHAQKGGKQEHNPYRGGLATLCERAWDTGFESYHNSFCLPQQTPISAHDNFVAED